MPTRPVTLTDHHEALIRTLVASGRYQCADDVVRDGLRMIERRESHDAAKREALRLVSEVGRAALQHNGHVEYSRPDGRLTELEGQPEPD